MDGDSLAWQTARPKLRFQHVDFGGRFQSLLPPLAKVRSRHMSHTIFHLDGKGLIRHLDTIFQLPDIQAIQWCRGGR